MELISSTFVLIFSFFVSVITLQKLITTRNKPKPNTPPGPPKLPFIGNLHLFTGSDPLHYTLRDLAKIYGPLMHLKLGEVDNLVVTSPDMAKEILKTHDVVFASRPSLMASEIGCYGSTDLAFSPYGDYWRQMRKICTQELLSAPRVQSFRPIRDEEVSDLCRWIARHEGEKVNLTQKVSMMSYDIMLRAALGQKTDDTAVFVRVVQEGMQNVSVFGISDVYPSLKAVLRPFSGMRRQVENDHEKMDMVLGKIVDDRRRENAAKVKGDGDEKKHIEDLLDVMLKCQASGSLEVPITNDNIKAVLMDMFGAGIDTSTSVVDWALAELLKNPRVLQKTQDELRHVFDANGRVVKESYFDQLEYLKLVMKETLRLHPTAPLLLPRECRESCRINGYDIPAKTRVLVNAWAMGRDPAFWEDAESFKPERFLEKAVDFKAASSFEYIPFGGGRRSCPGVTYGPTTIELQLAMLLYYFDWVLPDGMKPEDVQMNEVLGVASRRKHDVVVIPIVRRDVPV
ncbi:hypothetical protein CASFOL_026567 [Castilleja foliolosa]|uniref:Cytochrome P450 n=1 Tax=Castilleja foliolosa TaxID=1961234 RepID=A0ABD3CHG7_9LAMI